jgi:hypothetical protein
LVGSTSIKIAHFVPCFLPSFGSFGQAVSEKIFKNSANQKQELPVVAMLFLFLIGRFLKKYSPLLKER